MNIKIKFGLKDLEKRFGPITIGLILKNYRECEEITQRALAKKLKISAQRLNDFEKGRRLPDINSVVKFARILNDSEPFFVQVLFEDYLRSEKLKLEVKVTKKIA
jgi:transcriptional regulator with XRE-family HTH domain